MDNEKLRKLRDVISRYEGQKIKLLQTVGNPYETKYVTAEIKERRLTVLDEEREHGPDGGWSRYVFEFDEENTEKVFACLTQAGVDPMLILRAMMDKHRGTHYFVQMCEERGIAFIRKFVF